MFHKMTVVSTFEALLMINLISLLPTYLILVSNHWSSGQSICLSTNQEVLGSILETSTNLKVD